jgi:hypothetical protein
MRKFSLILSLLFTSFTAVAQTSGPVCNEKATSFFSGVGTNAERDIGAKALIESDPRIKAKLSLQNSQIVDVLDTGKSYRCDCFDYLVKYMDLRDGSTWIEQVKITQGKVELIP